MAILGTRYPSAPNAYRGIELEPVALQMKLIPAGCVAFSKSKVKVSFQFLGKYTYLLVPHGYKRGTGRTVAYYVAYNLRNRRTEYVVGPNRLEDFEREGELLAVAAGFLFGVSKTAAPSAVHIVVAMRHAWADRPWQALKSHMKAVGAMWTDPITVMGAIAEVGAIGGTGRAKPRPTPRPPRQLAKKPPGNLVASPVYRLYERDIVVVNTSQGRRAFYKSTGKNSGRKDKWFPIDEIWQHNGWFNKKAYIEGRPYRIKDPELADVSNQLAKMDLPRGSDVLKGTQEGAVVTMNRILDFFDVKVTKGTLFRPVREPKSKRWQWSTGQ